LSSWQILIVEDDEDSFRVIEEALQYFRSDVAVRGASNGRECLEVLGTFQPTLVIMDLDLPEVDGWAALSAIRANPATAHLLVVALTAYHSASVYEDALKAGFNGYYTKPIDVFSFGKSLAELIES
jgi:CheY-like chemotaxis protein